MLEHDHWQKGYVDQKFHEVEEIAYLDDRDGFIKLMKNLGVGIYPLKVLGCKMAIGCAAALLEGETGLIVDLNLILPL